MDWTEKRSSINRAWTMFALMLIMTESTLLSVSRRHRMRSIKCQTLISVVKEQPSLFQSQSGKRRMSWYVERHGHTANTRDQHIHQHHHKEMTFLFQRLTMALQRWKYCSLKYHDHRMTPFTLCLVIIFTPPLHGSVLVGINFKNNT